MNPPSQPGRIVVFAGPSGAGKSTVLRRVLKQCDRPLVFSVSATTRPPREGEVDGKHYHFLAPEAFHRRREAGEFLECFEVFGKGHWYGTPKSEVASSLNAGKWVVLEIDVQGAEEVLKHYPDAITIFLEPPSLEDLERRLRSRGTESEEQIARRLETARHEMEKAHMFRHRVVNRDVGEAVREICQLLERAEEPA